MAKQHPEAQVASPKTRQQHRTFVGSATSTTLSSPELLAEIFEYLDFRDIIVAARSVNKQWRAVVDETPALLWKTWRWRGSYERFFPAARGAGSDDGSAADLDEGADATAIPIADAILALNRSDDEEESGEESDYAEESDAESDERSVTISNADLGWYDKDLRDVESHPILDQISRWFCNRGLLVGSSLAEKILRSEVLSKSLCTRPAINWLKIEIRHAFSTDYVYTSAGSVELGHERGITVGELVRVLENLAMIDKDGYEIEYHPSPAFTAVEFKFKSRPGDQDVDGLAVVKFRNRGRNADRHGEVRYDSNRLNAPVIVRE